VNFIFVCRAPLLDADGRVSIGSKSVIISAMSGFPNSRFIVVSTCETATRKSSPASVPGEKIFGPDF
jgi:hypothetical protein